MIQKGREKLLLAPATRGNFRSNNMRRLCAHDNQPSLALVGKFAMKWKFNYLKIYKRKLVKNLRHLHRGEKEQRRKGRIYLEKEYICSAEEKKNGEGKG